jgi:hypothetical protein
MSIRDLILPKHFRTNVHYWNTFNNTQTEVSAQLIMQFLQQRDRDWEPFSEKELYSWYNSSGGDQFYFNYLICNDNPTRSPITKIRSQDPNDNLYKINDIFISKCASNPELIF